MRRITPRALAAVMTVGLAAAACAQPPDPTSFPTFLTEKAELLQNESVQKEIKLRPEQFAALKKSAADWEDRHRLDVANARAGTDLMKAMEVRRQALEHLTRSMNTILTGRQLDRLSQIHVQVQGVFVFLRPETRDTLGMTNEQLAAIRPLLADVRQQLAGLSQAAGELRTAGGPDPRKVQQVARAVWRIQQAGMDRVVLVLTPQQRRRFKDMVGEPFELKWGPPHTPDDRGKPPGDD
jgi:hypothetical protein